MIRHSPTVERIIKTRVEYLRFRRRTVRTKNLWRNENIIDMLDQRVTK